MKNFLAWLKDEESGQGMVEYGLLIALIAIVVVGALLTLGPTIKGKFDEANSKLNSTSGGTTTTGGN